MNYKDYQNARDAAWRLLIDLGIRELPIRPGVMCRALGAVFYLLRSYPYRIAASYSFDS